MPLEGIMMVLATYSLVAGEVARWEWKNYIQAESPQAKRNWWMGWWICWCTQAGALAAAVVCAISLLGSWVWQNP